MQLDDARSILFGEVLLEWAAAEAITPHRGTAQRASVGPIAAKLKAKTALTAAEHVELALQLFLDRRGLLGFFVQQDTVWHAGTIGHTSVGDLRVMRILREPYKVERLGSFVRNGHAQVANLGIEGFDPNRVVGHLIAVADDLQGDWCLIEGNNRAVGFCGLPADPLHRVKVIVGVCAASKAWPGW